MGSSLETKLAMISNVVCSYLEFYPHKALYVDLMQIKTRHRHRYRYGYGTGLFAARALPVSGNSSRGNI